MSKLPRIMLGFVAVLATATPALAGPQQAGASNAPPAEPSGATQRVKRVGTRMETIVVLGGAVDPAKQRWTDSGRATAVLPTVSDSAFLDVYDAGSAEPGADSRP